MGSGVLPTENAATTPYQGWRGVTCDLPTQHPSLPPGSDEDYCQLSSYLDLKTCGVAPDQAAMDQPKKGCPFHGVVLSKAAAFYHYRPLSGRHSIPSSSTTCLTYWSAAKRSFCMQHSVTVPAKHVVRTQYMQHKLQPISPQRGRKYRVVAH